MSQALANKRRIVILFRLSLFLPRIVGAALLPRIGFFASQHSAGSGLLGKLPLVI